MTQAAHTLVPTISASREVDPTTARIGGVVRRMLAERAIDREVDLDDDLRSAGLSSLDMVTLVLQVEAEFDLVVPEQSIVPINFRSIGSISRLVTSLFRKS